MKKCPYCAEDILDKAVKCKHCGEFLYETNAARRLPTRQLTRSQTDNKLGGVCGGLAVYTNLDPTLIRLMVVFTTLATGLLPGLVAYAICAMVVPMEGVPA